MGDVVEFPSPAQPELTPLEKERIRVRVLVEYLDATDPSWRTKIKNLVEGK